MPKNPKDLPPPRVLTQAEAKNRGEPAQYRILYPSGKDFMLTGVFGEMIAGREVHGPTMRLSDDKIVVLDPRGLVVRGDIVVYSPRTIMSSPAEYPIVLPPEMREWMREHPEWPPVEWFAAS